MMFSLGLRAIAISLGCATAAAASGQPTHYHCEFSRDATDGNWLPAEVDIIYDSASSLVRIIDPLIYYYNKGPIEGHMAGETKARITFAWDIRPRDIENHVIPMHYSLTYFRNGVPASISAHPHGYDNRMDAQGSCKVANA